MGNLDIASLLFSLPDGIFISSVRATTTNLVVRIACRRPCAACKFWNLMALTQLRCSQLWYNVLLNNFSKFTLFRGPILHLMILIPDIPNVLIEQVEVADEITLTLRPVSPTACCPSCGTISSRVQSRYSRTLHDLPASGRAVTLLIQVRRFFCKKSTCPRKI